jgi:hypothetical protein
MSSFNHAACEVIGETKRSHLTQGQGMEKIDIATRAIVGVLDRQAYQGGTWGQGMEKNGRRSQGDFRCFRPASLPRGYPR